MKSLAIDIETRSPVDLAECGVYKYAEHALFKILLFAYCEDGGEVRVIDLARGEALPQHIADAILDDNVEKTAFNATFERICLSRHLGLDEPLSPISWRCTMVASARAGLPLSLGQCGEVLGLEEGKMKEGKALIKKFSCPDKNGEFANPDEYPEDWETFKRYCMRDVEVEQAILKKVSRFEQPAWEQKLYAIDQEINDRGVMIDTQFVLKAEEFYSTYMAELLMAAKKLTGLDNPNSPTQLKEWFAEKANISSLNKKAFEDILSKVGKHSLAGRVLKLRQEMGKTSCKKFSAMLDCVCRDGRIHGLLQYYGAARTGRWAGRLVQVQNLPQNHLSDIEGARRLVKNADLDEFQMYYANVTQVLSELIRTSFIAKPGHTFHVCDFSAIEARVIAWLAGEEWVLDVFRQNGDIYCATASQMFGVPVEKHGANAELRQKGKIAVLALGYGGGPAALLAFGADKMGMTDREIQDTVQKWRNANPHIVRLWTVVERAAIRAITTGEKTVINRGVAFSRQYGCLIVTLPSGRNMCYPRAQYSEFENRFGKRAEAVSYEGLNQTTKKWERVETYGGKMVENIVQAIARDILGVVMMRAKRNGMNIVFHVHDEIIVEAPESLTLKDVEGIFDTPPEWAERLPLKGAGYTTPYYLKD